MKKQRLKTVAESIVLAAASALFINIAMAQQTPDAVLQTGEAKISAAQDSQERIDNLAEETADIEREFKIQNKQIEDLRVFNAQMEKQIARQKEAIADLELSLEKVTVIERQIQPLIFRMLDGLDQFVALDKPFLTQERKERLVMLRANQDRGDITVSEKFRQVLDAYKIESSYGTSIDAYKSTLRVENQAREVNILRIGRIALLYQTTDAKSSGYWDATKHEWVALDSSYNAQVLKGIRIARDQTASDIMILPVQAPEVAR
ncbi:MAG: DUF3450 domain-containing protein [Cellvibrio sp.]|uniref:DUF3450 domain-containing protein n=1 Tax=Cellvibrio sp. TaxID=1965322 RepID=UPI0031AFACA8